MCQGVQNAKEADECDPLKADTPSPDYCYDPLLHQPPEAKKEPWQYSLLALFPLRLGIEKVNEEYYQVSSFFSSLMNEFLDDSVIHRL